MAVRAAGPREMMQAELAKLRAPLVMLNALSRCLTDDPEEQEIRESLNAIVWRANVLEEQLEREHGPSSHEQGVQALLDEAQVRGTS